MKPLATNKIRPYLMVTPATTVFAVSSIYPIVYMVYLNGLRLWLLNYAIGLLGLPQVNWLSDTRIALTSLVMVSVWKSLRFNTLILVSAVQTIPAYLYEAAPAE